MEKEYSIKSLRTKFGITLESLSDVSGKAVSTLSGFEKREESKTVTIKKLEEMANLMGFKLILRFEYDEHTSAKLLKIVRETRGYKEFIINVFHNENCISDTDGGIEERINNKLKDFDFVSKITKSKSY